MKDTTGEINIKVFVRNEDVAPSMIGLAFDDRVNP